MQNSVAKKIFAVGSAVAMGALALAPLAALAAVHADGTNVSDASGTVYMIIGGQRRPYTSAGAFTSYGFNSFASVTTASAEDLALPVGSFIPPQDGSIICSDRGADKGTCYEISNGQKFGFTSAAVFTGLGFSFANSVSGDVSWMPAGSMLISNTTQAHLPGTLVNNGGTVQLVGSSSLLGVPDLATFNSWGYSFSKVVPANAADKTWTQSGVFAARVAGQLSPSWTTTVCTTNCNVQTGSVTASLSSDSPAAGTLVSTAVSNPQTPGQTSADLAHFTLTGTGTVTQVVIKRTGVSADTSVNNVYLYMGNNRITDAGTFSNGQVTFSNSNGLFTVNGTAEIGVRVDVAGGISGQTIGAQLASLTVANGSPMTVGVSGNTFTIAQVNNLATVNSASGLTAGIPGTNINAGTINANLWSLPISVGQRAVLLKYIAFKQIGSISQSAIQNLHLYVDGAAVGSTASITNNGSNTNVVVFDLTGAPVNLTTGSHTLELHGDVIGGTSYNFDFTLQQAADVVFYDTNYNVNVPLTVAGTTFVQLAPGTTTINSGTVSVQQDPTFSATQFVKNSSQVTLGQWTIKAYGEDVKVQNLAVKLNYFLADGATPVTPSSTDVFNNLSIYVNGGQVGSSQNATSPSSATPVYTFGTTNLFTIPAGTTVTVAVKGDSVFASNDYTGAVRTDLQTPVNSLQGVTSFALSPSTLATYTGISLTTSNGSGTLAKNTGYANQTVGANTTAQHIGSFVIQASNADGIRVTSVTITLASSTPGSGYTVFNNSGLPTGLANLYIVTPTGSLTPVNPGVTNNFSTNFTVAANQTATVDVYADVSNVTGNVIASMSAQGVGSSSNQTVTGLTNTSGQTITIGNGTVNNPPILQTSSPVASFVIGGSTNQPAATFNFVASNGGATIQELDFNASSTVSGAITSVTVGGVTSAVVGASSTVTGLNIVVPTNYSGIDVPVTVNFSNVGLNGITSNTPVQLVLSRVKYLSGSTTAYLPTNGSYGLTVSSNLFDLVGSSPTITLTQSGNTLTTGATVGSITIAANAAGNIIASTVPFTISTNNASLSGNLQLVDASSGQVAGTVATTVATSSSSSVTVNLTTDNNIAAGTSKVYNIVLGTVVTTPGANNYSVTVGMGAATGFKFKDVNGNVADIPGGAYGVTFIVNYPTNTVTSHQ
jgi:hypothetical protein